MGVPSVGRTDFRGRSDNEPSDEYDVVCTYITVIYHMNVWPAGQDAPPRPREVQSILTPTDHSTPRRFRNDEPSGGVSWAEPS